ncbi:MAG: hypothetical protein II016_02160 [Erysipelotrichaceae bacterium]|nr:hypothetical protein [Erysipelotrichaceae bacterium]
MIYTCTTNPSLDYYIELSEPLADGKVNRTTAEHYEAGGKGVNVSIALSHMFIPSVALGFLGGFPREYYLSFLSGFRSLQPIFTKIKDNTRINVKVTGSNTAINARGPQVTEEEFTRFKTYLERIYANDYFVLSGNVQNGLEERMTGAVETLISDRVKVVLDTNPEIMKAALKMHPYMVRLNEYDLPFLSKKKDIVEALKDIYAKGPSHVLYNNDDEVYLVCEEGVYFTRADETQDQIGRDDSLIAGFLLAKQRGATGKEALTYAVAASQINYLDEHDPQDLEDFADKLVIEHL